MNLQKNINLFFYKNEELKLTSKYYRKLDRDDKIYFECTKRRYGCNGTCIYYKNDKKMILTSNCDKKVEHDIISFEQFKKDYKKNNLHDYNMKFKKYQEFFIKCLFINNDIILYVECYKKFKDQFNIYLQLNNKEISDIKYKTIGYLTLWLRLEQGPLHLNIEM